MRGTDRPILKAHKLWDEEQENDWGPLLLSPKLQKTSSMSSEAECVRPRNIDKMRRKLPFALMTEEIAHILATGTYPEEKFVVHTPPAAEVHANPFSVLEC